MPKRSSGEDADDIGGDSIIDHMAYWTTARSQEEAAYLVAVLNSAAVLEKISDLQPHGQRDKRHFDNLVWTLPIPNMTTPNLCTATSLPRPAGPRALRLPFP